MPSVPVGAMRSISSGGTAVEEPALLARKSRGGRYCAAAVRQRQPRTHKHYALLSEVSGIAARKHPSAVGVADEAILHRYHAFWNELPWLLRLRQVIKDAGPSDFCPSFRKPFEQRISYTVMCATILDTLKLLEQLGQCFTGKLPSVDNVDAIRNEERAHARCQAPIDPSRRCDYQSHAG
jgi:hypothetical protein